MKPIITVENVSKKYSRNANQHLSYGIRDLFNQVVARGRRDPVLRKDEFWAVDDASFHLYPGDSIALIGRNGSGKTTLLKMMHGLTKPDKGRILIDGRVQALINLGAGFNPALTGRDNVINAAALMGMGPRETAQLVEEVVEFAELEDFIDSPVETYSSGMKARLGFSAAINLQPDILLIDEILAVGDSAFQNKCFIRMHELKKAGVTIVLVSHNYTNVVQVCERAIWLHKGETKHAGESKETVQAYLDYLDAEQSERVARLNELHAANAEAMEKKKARVSVFGAIYDEFDRIDQLDIQFLVDGNAVDSFPSHSRVEIRYRFRLLERVTDLNVSLVFCTPDGKPLSAISTLNGDLLKSVREGVVDCSVTIPDFNLAPGEYCLLMPIHEGKSYLYRNVVKRFAVTSNGRLAWHLFDFAYEYRLNAPAGGA